jgi:RNase H-fold protein (predicted Holliday junction resolvase)
VTRGPVLGVDPGTRKVGLAVVAAPLVPPIALEIVPLESFGGRIDELVARHGVRAFALGGGTHAGPVAGLLGRFGLPVGIVDERDTTLLARARYFQAHPPRGWRRLIPRGMLLPPCPIDDFAALLIAERYLQSEVAAEG